MPRPSGGLVVLVTCPTRRSADGLAKALVRTHAAACVNILPNVRSLFWWEGKVDRARETLLVIKTTAGRFDAIQRTVRALHPYAIPEVIALPITRAHPPYLRWVASSVSPSL